MHHPNFQGKKKQKKNLDQPPPWRKDSRLKGQPRLYGKSSPPAP